MMGFRQNKARLLRGFTLVELLAVIIILGVIAAVAVPVAITAVEKARRAADEANVAVLNNSIQYYYLLKGEFPTDLNDLVQAGQLTGLPEDPWKKDRKYTIHSTDPDSAQYMTVLPLGNPKENEDGNQGS